MHTTLTPRRHLAGVLALTLWAGAAQPVRADPALYQKAARSTVVFLLNGEPIGTGTLVDAPRRLVATAAHVTNVYGGSPFRVVFARTNAKGKVITNWAEYRKAFHKQAIKGRVVRSDDRIDLAIVQLDAIPEGVSAVPLAEDSVSPGERVHVIGHSDARFNAVFSYCTGLVRVVAHPLKGPARVLHATPTNPGDSGGPLLNDQGELVGVVSGGTTGMSAEQVIWYARQVIRLWQKDGMAKLEATPRPPREAQVRDQAVDVHDIKQMLDAARAAVDAKSARAK